LSFIFAQESDPCPQPELNILDIDGLIKTGLTSLYLKNGNYRFSADRVEITGKDGEDKDHLLFHNPLINDKEIALLEEDCPKKISILGFNLCKSSIRPAVESLCHSLNLEAPKEEDYYDIPETWNWRTTMEYSIFKQDPNNGTIELLNQSGAIPTPSETPPQGLAAIPQVVFKKLKCKIP
jgi:hypothetical protein